MRKNKRWFLCIVCFLLAAAILPVTAFAEGAVDTEHPASLTVKCVHGGRKLAGMTFDLYKVSEMDVYGKYTLTDAFSEYSVSLEQESAAGWRALAGTLAQYVRRDNVPIIRQGTADSAGQVSFTELGVGMYLAYGYRYTSGDFVYTPEPFLVSLPSLDENGDWFYDAEASCKGEGYTNPPDTTTVKVLKVWDDKGHKSNRPNDIEVQLLCNDRVYDTVTLHAGNNYRHTWPDLDAGCRWFVVEKEVPENYTLLVNREGVTFVLTNTYEPTFTMVEVEKVWKDSGYESKRPTEVNVQLLRDGQVYATVTLNAVNNWKYMWTDLEAGRDWTVKESSSPAGYTSSVKQSNNRFTITNTYTPSPPAGAPKLPQTGQLWWPIPVLIGIGLVFYLAGFLWRKTRKPHDE